MMTSLKTWCLLSLSVLLLLSIAPTGTEVVQSMSDCEGFLLNENPPQIPGILINGNIQDQKRYKIICQTYKNQTRFVTLYDTNNKIPVFSAYKYRGEGPLDEDMKRQNVPWKIEPQLEERDSMSNMWDDVYKNQASNNDYINNLGYNRGHLFPYSHAFDQDQKNSTFTLTNVVPQAITFNNGSWAKMESCVKCVLQKYCINNDNVPEGFVVTGAKPVTETLNTWVNIPSVLWSAFCCYSKNKNKWLASAHWGNNTAEDSKSKYLETKTLEELHQELSIEAFPNSPQCPLTETVSEFYPEIKKNCKCPLQAPTTTAPPTTPSTTAAATVSTIISTTTVPTATPSTTAAATLSTNISTTTVPPTTPSTTAAATLSTNISTTTVPPTTPSTTAAATLSTNISTTTVPTTTTSTRVTNASVPVDVGSSVLESVFRWLLVILEYALGSIKVVYPEVPGTSQNVTTTTSPFASTLGQTTTTIFNYSATAHPTFSTTTPTTTETPKANFTLTSTVSNITAPPQSNVTVNDTITTFSTATESQTKPPRHPSSRRKLSTVKPQVHKTEEPVLEAEERSIGSGRTPQI
ncbi:uncharacterized protein [Channa argus]|uniref:uncharacterized protein n=1 Tax=Channa argus TaxID=215402 RepID=UPI0035210CBA